MAEEGRAKRRSGRAFPVAHRFSQVNAQPVVLRVNGLQIRQIGERAEVSTLAGLLRSPVYFCRQFIMAALDGVQLDLYNRCHPSGYGIAAPEGWQVFVDFSMLAT